jgi:hypothetical protein
VLDIHELAAGKLTALLERQTGRDLFDANQLFQYKEINKEKLRLLFVLYSAMCSKKNILKIGIDDIDVNLADLKNKLVPVMKSAFFDGFSSVEEWTGRIVENVRSGFGCLLPFSALEEAFILSVMLGEGIKPELITSDPSLRGVIKAHPALLWAQKRAKRK